MPLQDGIIFHEKDSLDRGIDIRFVMFDFRNAMYSTHFNGFLY
ncbi:hypothetical protein PEPS_10690 [Persicobacter psychrovividus]|uniref:Uncharacterized protein n=1 Tax=Persicobacter psychrovividus TaxID=387638 RepID=A0ABM7VD03_9BACT|nr:hypothetical protein PEPS_10690 [Persicobacter psychrovividus]